MSHIKFSYQFNPQQQIIFDQDLAGLKFNNQVFFAGVDDPLIYYQVKDLHANQVECQLSTNTSTLIPALRILGIKYHPYFDEKAVVDSQNNISFYWQPSALAAFYNRFGTDDLPYDQRQSVIKKAVEFLTTHTDGTKELLPAEQLQKMTETCKLLGFYQGFPIFDSRFGLPKLMTRLGIHINETEIMISTPLDKYSQDVVDLAKLIEQKTHIKGVWKKNRVRFGKNQQILSELLPYHLNKC